MDKKTVMMLMIGGTLLATNVAPAATDINTTTVTADSRDYTLIVSSARGAPVPSIGTNLYAWRATVTCSVASAVSEGGTNYICSGWTGSGAIPVSGSTNNTGAVMLTALASSITWNWISPLFDSDSDGVPDSWELQYFGGTTNANPNSVCSNGINTVRQAYIAGLNPNDRQSAFRASAPSNNGRVFGWSPTSSGRVYSVYWTTNLLSGFNQCLESNIPWTRGSFTNPVTVPKGYYKIDVRME